jgi:hypothetical protein
MYERARLVLWNFVIAALLLAVSAPARAQVTPLGSEFGINAYTTGTQRMPAVAAAANGNIATAWSDYSRDGSILGVFGRRFDSSGNALGTDFQVNTYTTAEQGQYSLAVATAANGDFLVVWDSLDQDGSGLGIFGQLYASGGGPIGTEFQVNTYTTGTQKNASVGVTNGTFLVAWESDQGISNNDIFAQRYDSGGAALGTEFQVNTYTTSYQHSVAVAGGGTGSFVIVWDSFMQDGSYGSVFGQRYDSNGTAVGTEFQVNTYTTSTFPGRFPSVAVAPNGGFVVAWNNDADQDGSGDGVFAQRYDSTGSPQGAEFQVNTFTTGGQFRSSVATTDDDFVIVWDGFDQDGSGLGVFARRFASTGSAIGTDFQVNTAHSDRLPSTDTAARTGGHSSRSVTVISGGASWARPNSDRRHRAETAMTAADRRNSRVGSRERRAITSES